MHISIHTSHCVNTILVMSSHSVKRLSLVTGILCIGCVGMTALYVCIIPASHGVIIVMYVRSRRMWYQLAPCTSLQ